MKTNEAIRIYLTEHDFKPNTVYGYDWLQYHLDKAAVTEWFESHRDVLAFVKEKSQTKPISQKKLLKEIKAICAYLERAYDIANPCKKIERGAIRYVKPEMPFLNEEQLMKCIQACKTPLERITVMMCIETAARASELASLRPRDLGENEITTFDEGKTGRHKYACSPELIDIMRQYCAAIGKTDDDYILEERKYNRAYNRQDDLKRRTTQLENRVRTVLLRTGFVNRKIGPHIFRRSTGSLVASETRSVLEVMKHLQQSDVKTAMVYIQDAEQRSSKRLSPLKIIAEKVTGNANTPTTQLALAETTAVILPDGTEIKQSNNIMLFPIPTACQQLHPTFKRADLELIATAFAALTDKVEYGKTSSDCKHLWDRMFRLVKKD